MKSSQLKYFGVLAIALLGLLSTTSATAAPFGCVQDAWSPPAPTDITTNWAAGTPVNLGDVFISNVTSNVCALGIYAGNDATYVVPETVGLYDASGNLLTSTTVTDTDPLFDGYYWASTPAATVFAGDTYTVVDQVYVNGWGYGPVPVNNWGTFQYDDYLYASGLSFTTNTGGSGPTYYGGNVMISPEPGTMLLLGSGLLGLAGIVRRRFHKS